MDSFDSFKSGMSRVPVLAARTCVQLYISYNCNRLSALFCVVTIISNWSFQFRLGFDFY